MKTLDIVIPSHNREGKLINCLNSIIKAKKLHYDIEVYVYFNDISSVKEFAVSFPLRWINYKVVKNYKVPEFWNSHLKSMHADALMYCNDDVTFYEDTLTELFYEYSNKFPNLDGVMGINQVNLNCPNKLEGAFGVIGKNFLNNFPDKKVWCPDYYRLYADAELELFARSINKFYYSEKTRINHYHGSFYIKDETHNNVRTYLKKDKRTYTKRRAQNLLWGKDFTLLGEKNEIQSNCSN